MTYRELQKALKTLRKKGVKVQCKLNAKKIILLAEYNRLTQVQPSKTVEETVISYLQSAQSQMATIADLRKIGATDSLLIQLNIDDKIDLFTGEVSSDEWHKGIFLQGVTAPRTWAKLAA